MRFLFSVSILLFCNIFFAFGQKMKDRMTANVRGSDKFIDSIPHFLFEKAELDSFFVCTSRIPPVADLDGINGFVKLSFYVDTNGQINNLEVLDSKAIISQYMYEWTSDSAASQIRNYYKNEAVRLINCTNGLWVKGMKEGRYYNGKVIADINFLTETYERNQKVEKRALRSKRPSSITYWAVGAPVNSMKFKSLYNIGVKKMNMKKNELAIIYLKEAVDHNSHDIDAYYNMGIAYYKLRKTKEACESWEKGKQEGDNGAMEMVRKYCNK